jgi:error-prone DNA polymerase
VEPFVHLATRTAYSLRDGIIRPTELARRAADHAMAAVGVADRGGLYGAVRLALACAETGVRPLFAADLALRPDPAGPGWGDRRRSGWHGSVRAGGRGPGSGASWLEGDPARVILLASDQKGYAALCRTVGAHHLECERGAPHTTWEQLTRFGGSHPGWFALFGDDAPAARLLDEGRFDAAVAETNRWVDLLGADRVLVGVTHHLARGDDERARRRFALADRLGLRAVAHQAARYLHPADAAVADVVDAIRGQVPVTARNSQRRGNTEGYLKSPARMASVFAERSDALRNTVWVAERCDVDLGLGKLRAPDFVGASHAMEELRGRCLAGLEDRYPDAGERHRRRLDEELAMISRLGLASYFLTVSEIVERIRAKQIMVACRGSAAGSIVCFCLRVSDVDPIRHDLCYERFMNPYRDDLPDIDLDVESARREDIYRDLLDRYGDERVACVTMIERFQARMAIREVGKALGLPAPEVDQIAKSFPRIRARDVRKAIDLLPEMDGRNLDAAHLRTLFDLVERLDGLPRHLALHPSGVLLGDGALRDMVPVERSAHGFAMAQFDKDDVEALGFCKLDVLAVRMLSAMSHAVDEARRVRGAEIDFSQVPHDDPDTYELIRSTRTVGMFQIESPGQRELLGRFQPEYADDLVVDISLFRPGPVKGDMVGPFLLRRLGKAEPVIPHPLLERALGETFGVIVYHEQVMRSVAALTGCDLSTADLVRRRLGDPDEVPRIRRWVLETAVERGVPGDVAASLMTSLEQFASFGFCKAHAAAFAVPTYRSAWLKRHYCPELVAGLLTHDPGMYPRRLILSDARQFGVCVLPLDVNRSDRTYRVERVPAAIAEAALPEASAPVSGFDLGDAGDGERFGIRLALQDVAGIDEAMIDSLLAGRPFTGLADLRERARLSRPVAEALAHVGALDSIGEGRARRDLLLEVAERWSRSPRRRPAANDPEQLDMLGPGPPPGLGGYRPSEQVRAELDVLGLDASRPVISFYDRLLDVLDVTRATDLLDVRDRHRVRVAGVKVATQTPPVKSGQRVIFLSLDDATGVADAAFFESVHDRCARTVFHSWLLVVEGTVRRSGARGVSVNADRVWDLAALMRAWRQGTLDAALSGGPPATAAAAPRRLWHRSGGSAG